MCPDGPLLMSDVCLKGSGYKSCPKWNSGHVTSFCDYFSRWTAPAGTWVRNVRAVFELEHEEQQEEGGLALPGLSQGSSLEPFWAVTSTAHRRVLVSLEAKEARVGKALRRHHHSSQSLPPGPQGKSAGNSLKMLARKQNQK